MGLRVNEDTKVQTDLKSIWFVGGVVFVVALWVANIDITQAAHGVAIDRHTELDQKIAEDLSKVKEDVAHIRGLLERR
jgi:hypothetical protein